MLFTIIILNGCSKKDYKSPHIKEISYENFKERLANKEKFAIYIGNDNCTYCNEYMPTLNEFLDEYNVDIFQLDNSKMSDEEYKEFKTYVNISGTPTIAFIENGEEETALNRLVGAETKESTINKFKINGYIK